MNRETAARLLEKSLKDIFAFSVSRLYNKQDAEDLTNDIVAEVLASVGRLECDSAFYGFMWKIAENTLKRYIRGKNTENTEFIALATENPCANIALANTPFIAATK